MTGLLLFCCNVVLWAAFAVVSVGFVAVIVAAVTDPMVYPADQDPE